MQMPSNEVLQEKWSPLLNYEGIDPEIFGGIDNNIYPRARTFVFGLNASF